MAKSKAGGHMYKNVIKRYIDIVLAAIALAAGVVMLLL